jgi:integrase
MTTCSTPTTGSAAHPEMAGHQYEWKPLLQEAGVRDPRLHDARHKAATTLLLLGVPEQAVMDFMGWSHAAMIKRYSHVTARLRQDRADRLDPYLWA